MEAASLDVPVSKISPQNHVEILINEISRSLLYTNLSIFI